MFGLPLLFIKPRVDPRPARRGRIVSRLFQIIDLPFGIGVLVGVLTPRTQRFGDLAAGTFVVREPKQNKTIGAVVFPLLALVFAWAGVRCWVRAGRAGGPPLQR